jgi:CDP-paratose 2-epimerase
MVQVRNSIGATKGNVYNLGGGMQRAVSILEMLKAIEKETGKKVLCSHGGVRPGDQPLYISDTSKLRRDTGWQPRRRIADILADIHSFWRESQAADELADRHPAASHVPALGEVA